MPENYMANSYKKQVRQAIRRISQVEQLTPAEKLLYLTLLSESDDSGVVHLSHNELATKSGLTRRSAIRSVAKLASNGLVIVSHVKEDKGASLPNKYLVLGGAV